MMDKWESCYDDGWQGDITPEAFSHPAKKDCAGGFEKVERCDWHHGEPLWEYRKPRNFNGSCWCQSNYIESAVPIWYS